MVKDYKIYLVYILESIESIETYMKGIDEELFKKSPMVRDAVVKNIENIGETARNMPEDFKKQYQDIPWQDMADMRNFLVHEYFGIDSEEVLNTVNNDLPELKEKIENILS